jgi:putative transposase
MALPRPLAPQSVAHPLYHCVSRVVDRRMIFQPAEKEQFVRYMRRYERLCGVKVLTYCVMGNHFHLLVEVPRRPEVPPNEAELIALVEETLGQPAAQALSSRLEHWREHNNTMAIAKELERWYAQMWDLGRFMKMVKQRFSCWYNQRQSVRRTGTLWEERYRSVLVGSGTALQATALYIDLNPVRAGIVADPKDYRWSGYGEAAAGVYTSQAALARMAELSSPALANRTQEERSWLADTMSWYREALYGRGAEVRDEAGTIVRRGFSSSEIEAVRDAHGDLPLRAYLGLRVRYLTAGAVFGTKEFVEQVFQGRRNWFSPKRHSGARRLKGLARDCPLRTARALTVQPYG